MTPRDLTTRLVVLLLLPLLVAAAVFYQRPVEIAAGVLVLLAALRPAREIVVGRPDSPLGRRGAAWVAGLFGLVGGGLLAAGVLPASFLAAGYVGLSLLGLVAFAGEFWGAAGNRLSGLLVALLLVAYAAAGFLLWSPG